VVRIKKPKIKVLYPADITTDQSYEIYAKYVHSFEVLSKDFDVEIVGRIKEDVFKKLYPNSLPYVYFFDSEIFSRNLSREEIDKAEQYVGLSFNYMFFSNQKRWYWLNKSGLDEKVARYVYAWQELLKDTDVIIPTLDNLFYMHTAERVAERMGIKVIKMIRGRLVNDSLIFWNINNQPIYYKSRSKEGIAEKFVDRTLKQKTNVKIDKTAINKTENLLFRFVNMPKKLFLLVEDKDRALDADIPSLLPKYIRLFSMGMRYLLYPSLHSLLFENSRKEDYFLFPLHYEWEAQLAYREPFINQLKLAKQISEILPRNTYLYIKVHPHWKNADQSFLEALNLKRQKNIRLIHPSENTTELIRNSLGVIILNSTVGYEALLLRKPLIVLGHEAYREVGIDVKDMNMLPRVLMSVKNGEYRVDTQNYHRFLRKYTSNIFSTDDPKKIASELKEVITWMLSRSE